MTSKLPGEMDGRRFVRAHQRLGWEPDRWHGSHLILVHSETGEVMTISFHGTIYRAFARKILKDHGIPEEIFLEEY